MFYVATALLYEQGLSFTKHSAVHAAFGKTFAKTQKLDPKYHRWLIDAFDARLLTDYGFDKEVTLEEVGTLLEQASTFLEAASEFLKGATD